MTKKDAKQEAIAALDSLQRGDPEMAHCDADEHLLKYLERTGSQEVADAYQRARMRIGFWYA